MKMQILIHPDSRLRKVCEPVSDLSDIRRALAGDMLETMYAAPGIGLAAPQVGVLERLIVIDCMREEGVSCRPVVMFNPEIAAVSDETNTYKEGCLSIPDHFAEITRPRDIEVEWLDHDGALRKEGFGGLWATVIQHEIDHLNGKLFIDYLGPVRRQMITRKMQRFKREQMRPV